MIDTRFNPSRCPVCWRTVKPTPYQRIDTHWDTAGGMCEGGGEPFYITVKLRRPRKAELDEIAS